MPPSELELKEGDTFEMRKKRWLLCLPTDGTVKAMKAVEVSLGLLAFLSGNLTSHVLFLRPQPPDEDDRLRGSRLSHPIWLSPHMLLMMQPTDNLIVR